MLGKRKPLMKTCIECKERKLIKEFSVSNKKYCVYKYKCKQCET